MSVNRLIDPAAWMDHVRRVHRDPGRLRRLRRHARELGMLPADYVAAVNEATRELVGRLRVGVLLTPERLAGLRGKGPRAGRPEADARIAGDRDSFECSLFHGPHRVTYALLFEEPERIPAVLAGCYGSRLAELSRDRVLGDATLTCGDSVVEADGLLSERGICTLRRPGDVLFDFRFEPLVPLREGDPFSFGDASYLEVQVHRPLVAEDLLGEWELG